MPETFPKKEINGIYEIDCKEVDIWEQPLAVVQPFPFLSLPDVLRGRVLEFVLVASEGSTLRLPRGCFPDRVPYSAAASLRTLAFHSRSIKAVCKAVAGDTRLIERRIATPAGCLAQSAVGPQRRAGPRMSALSRRGGPGEGRLRLLLLRQVPRRLAGQNAAGHEDALSDLSHARRPRHAT